MTPERDLEVYERELAKAKKVVADMEELIKATKAAIAKRVKDEVTALAEKE